MNPILFRCDASLSIGSGHVMRCRTLARELQRRGATIMFLCRRQAGDLISTLEREFPVLALPEQPLAAREELAGRELYGAWLGCSQEQDAGQCLEVVAQAGLTRASWLVVDHYGLDACWETELVAGLAGDAPPKLLVIDDLADRPHQADLLLDQNVLGKESERRYQGLVPPQCRQLLGPHYALLGPEYTQLHSLVPTRKILKRMLVFFGGADPTNLTGKALEILLNPALADLAVDVVLGQQSQHRQAVVELVTGRSNVTLHGPMPSLAGLMARADLALGAAGSTTWERACLGLPSLLVVEDANQQTVADTAQASGASLNLGQSLDPKRLEQAIAQCGPSALERMSNACLKLCDGNGITRMIQAMLT